MADTAQIVKSGTWQYDGCVLHEVWIVKQNFDFYYDDGFEVAPENLNEDGELFQIVVAKDGQSLPIPPTDRCQPKPGFRVRPASMLNPVLDAGASSTGSSTKQTYRGA